jgi:hypothetical protein
VGPFFYGPDPGPCSYTETDQPSSNSPKIYTVVYTYADGLATLAATGNNDHHFEYTYVDGLLDREDKHFELGLLSSVTYRYGAGTAGYTRFSPANKNHSYDYVLDDKGYPQTLTYSEKDNGQDATPAGTGVRFVYEYADCRIQKLTGYTSGGAVDSASTSTFSYDDAGHLLEVNSANYDFTYDYACWEPVSHDE